MTRLLVIYTGGTIGMANDAATGALVPFDFLQIRDNLPELKRLDYVLDVVPFDPPVDSSDMSIEIWQKLGRLVYENYNAYCGFVILHGSDTMAYTAAALSFMLNGLAKPVVLTGSQLPIGQIRTDAKENLLTALEIAAAKQPDGAATVPEVCVYFDYQLYRGNRVFKQSAAQFDAFASLNWPILAQAGVKLTFHQRYIRTAGHTNLQLLDSFGTDVEVVKIYPGLGSKALEAKLNSGAKVVILETFGAGNAPSAPWFLDILGKALSRGVVIFNITQCRNGSVEMATYGTGKGMLELGVVSGSDIVFEAAAVKAMHALGMGLTGENLKQYLAADICGELTPQAG